MAKKNRLSKILTLFPPQTVLSVFLLIAVAVLHVLAWLPIVQLVTPTSFRWVIVIFDIALAALYLILSIYQMVTRSSRYSEGKAPKNPSNYEFAHWMVGLLGFLFLAIFGLILVIGSADADFDATNVANYVALTTFYGYNLVASFVVIVAALFNFPAHGNYQRTSMLQAYVMNQFEGTNGAFVESSAPLRSHKQMQAVSVI